MLLLLSFLLFLLAVLRPWATIPKPRLPPGPPKLPLLGNLHQLLLNSSTLTHHLFLRLARRHGPIMHLQLGEVSAIIITSSELAKSVLQTHEADHFPQRFPTLLFDVVGYGPSGLLISPYGRDWRQLRKLCMLEVLGPRRVRAFRKVREEEVRARIASITSTTAVNFSRLAYRVSSDITTRAFFGKKCGDSDELIWLVAKGAELGGGLDLMDLFASFKFLHRFNTIRPVLEKMHGELDRILDGIIEDHREKRRTRLSTGDARGGEDDDLVDVLLGLQEANDAEFAVTDTKIKAVLTVRIRLLISLVTVFF